MSSDVKDEGRPSDAETLVELDAEAGRKSSIDVLLSRVDAPEVGASAAPAVGLRTARVVRHERRSATIRFRSGDDEISAVIAPDVDVELVALAYKNGDRVLVEAEAGLPPAIVGVLQTRVPRELVLKAENVRIEGQREVTVVSGRAAMRMRHDGDLELVATRISAASRGFFKLVGRMLRLN
jgi:hypothetical protein